ncbi:MAG: hypothetical protein PCFJNLEI_00099 [Verrucomicrobiae bacterium]|nr:hypothetical protein [Verrucomicrobiae bacterium]
MTTGRHEFADRWQANAQLAWDTLAMKPTRGIGTWEFQTMQWSQLEELSGNLPGSYPQEPVRVYREFMLKGGVSYLDQWIPENPLSMKDQGYTADTARSATGGAEAIVCDGMPIDSPEDVVAHMEKYLIPRWQHHLQAIELDPDAVVRKLIDEELAVQRLFGPNMLKGPYVFSFPAFRYFEYGYQNYFMAYALYPEIIERDFKLAADCSAAYNRCVARAILEAGLPRMLRLDHDMADSRGMLVDVHSLDRIWFPHFVRAIQPFFDADIRLIWHCDGNLMDMVPRLLEVGISGFQGFQYEDGMDYPAICKMKDSAGNPLFIIAGVSVTRTLPHGTAAAVRDELRWLVENGPPVGLLLGCTSSITPGVPLENLRALIDGFRYYREHGRQGIS